MFFAEYEKTVAIRISRTFNKALLRRMDSESKTNRKGFLVRAGLAVAAVFAVSSTARKTQGSASSAAQSLPSGAMARVRTAKGAVARKA